MKLRSLFTAFLLVLAGQLLTAQDSVRISLPDLITDGPGVQVCVPITAGAFPDIISAQWSVIWDTDLFDYTSVDLGANPLNLTSQSYNAAQDTAVGFSWIAPGLIGVTLPAGTVLARVCLTSLTNQGTSSLSFNGYLSPEFVQEGQLTPYPTVATNGSLNIQEMVGTNDPVWAAELRVYPNPARSGDLLQVDLPNVRLETAVLTQLDGREVQRFTGDLTRLNLQQLPAGTYLLRLRAQGTWVTRTVAVR
ncbi:MAG: T9SS type A sorting domain-containing protein [Saprospiraceae bacterium]